jgi:hypothetical protein
VFITSNAHQNSGFSPSHTKFRKSKLGGHLFGELLDQFLVDLFLEGLFEVNIGDRVPVTFLKIKIIHSLQFLRPQLVKFLFQKFNMPLGSGHANFPPFYRQISHRIGFIFWIGGLK